MSQAPRQRLHPELGTLAVALVSVLAMVLAGVLLLAIGGLVLSGSGQEADSEAVRAWAQDRILLGTLVMWLVLLPVGRWFGGWLAGLDGPAMGLVAERSGALFWIGLLLGAATLLVPAGLGRIFGFVVPADSADLAVATGVTALPGVLYALPALGIAALGEELLTRGWLIPYWRPAVGTRGALVVSSLVFTALHLSNAHASMLGAIGVLLAGVWLGLALLTTRSLWLGTGLHLGWNAATALVLGLPVSGYSLPALLRWETADGDLARRLFGGSFGPEEGLLFHASITLSLVVVLAIGPAIGWGQPAGEESPEEERGRAEEQGAG